MKYILSPYYDTEFNKYLLNYIKAQLKKKANKVEPNFKFEDTEYTLVEVINSIVITGRRIYFSNQKLINYLVYDLSQRFWYTELDYINNIIHKLYLEFNHKNDKINSKSK